MILAIAVPIMIQNGITNFVGLLDNIMVGMLFFYAWHVVQQNGVLSGMWPL